MNHFFKLNFKSKKLTSRRFIYIKIDNQDFLKTSYMFWFLTNLGPGIYFIKYIITIKSNIFVLKNMRQLT